MAQAGQERRRWWLLSALAGAVVIGGTVALGAVPGQVACDGNAALGPVLRFELVTSVAEVEALFGQPPCRDTLIAAMDRVNWLDVMLFIPAFTLFQLFAAFALRPLGRLRSVLAFNLAIAAAACDLFEDYHLLLITNQLKPGMAGVDPALLDPLYWLVRVKFALLALVVMLLGRLVMRRGGRGWVLTGWAMVAAGLVGLAGQYRPDLLSAGIGAGWAILLGVAVLGAMGRTGAPSGQAPA